MVDYKRRLIRLEEEFKSRGLDSFLVTCEKNVSYLSGMVASDSMILLTAKRRFFITDSRYVEEAKSSLKNFFEIELVRDSNYETLKKLVKQANLKRMGFESMSLPYGVVRRLRSLVEKAKLLPVKGLVESLRAIKDEDELRLIKNSIRLTKNVLNRTLKYVRPGISEGSISRKIELEFIKNDAHPAFEPIVASGRNSSKPHARATNRRIKKDDYIMIDIGCNLSGYNSDMTRMVFLGKPKERFKKIYNIVHMAKMKALERIRPGVGIRDVDRAARGFIEERGFGRYFGHSLGHGIGLDVHEEPTISRLNAGALKPGMVFTIEPAIYIPKYGGVRIEEMVVVTDAGCEILTR